MRDYSKRQTAQKCDCLALPISCRCSPRQLADVGVAQSAMRQHYATVAELLSPVQSLELLCRPFNVHAPLNWIAAAARGEPRDLCQLFARLALRA
jgi:hypothetical protein